MSFYEPLWYLRTYIHCFLFCPNPKFNQNTANIVQHQTTDLIIWWSEVIPNQNFQHLINNKATTKRSLSEQTRSCLKWNLNMNPLTYSNVSYIFGIYASRRWIWVLLGVCTTPRFKARMTLKNCYFSQLLKIFKVRRAFEPEVIQTSKSTHFLRLEVLIPNM